MNRLRLRKQSRTPSARPGEIQVFQDSDETLKQVDEEGTVTALGGGSPGGSQPVNDSLDLSDVGVTVGTPADTSLLSKASLAVTQTGGVSSGSGPAPLPQNANVYLLTHVAGRGWIALAARPFNEASPILSANNQPSFQVPGADQNDPETGTAVAQYLGDETVIVLWLLGNAPSGASDIVTDFGDPNADLDFSHDNASDGNFQSLWSVELRDPGAADQALAVTMDGFDLLVMLATDGDGEITSTAQEVSDAVGLDVDFTCWAAVATVGDGSGVVSALPKTNFPSDGDDGTGPVTATVDVTYS